MSNKANYVDRRSSAKARRIRKQWLLDTFGTGLIVNCALCGKWLNFASLTVDRIVCAHLGGRYTRDNIRPACKSCNEERGNACKRGQCSVEGERREMPEVNQVKEMIRDAGGKVDEVMLLPDGHGVATASFPLPKDHWLYKDEEFNVPPMPFRIGGTQHELRIEWRKKIIQAARYAVRSATMNGKVDDFDPDALVQNMVVGMIGYFTDDGLSSEEWANPTPVPPLVLDYKAAAEALWEILDDIDTVSDMVKGNDAGYRDMVEKLQKKRNDWMYSADGHTLVPGPALVDPK